MLTLLYGDAANDHLATMLVPDALLIGPGTEIPFEYVPVAAFASVCRFPTNPNRVITEISGNGPQFRTFSFGQIKQSPLLTNYLVYVEQDNPPPSMVVFKDFHEWYNRVLADTDWIARNRISEGVHHVCSDLIAAGVHVVVTTAAKSNMPIFPRSAASLATARIPCFAQEKPMAKSNDSFNPADHLTKLKGQDYLEVKWRLVWLRTEAPDARIETTLISHDPEKLAVFKAVVTLADGRTGSGHGSETPNDFRDYLEKAETKAIGRALGSLGFGTQFCDDFDTGIRADGTPSLADAPVARSVKSAPPTKATVKTPTPIAEADIKLMKRNALMVYADTYGTEHVKGMIAERYAPKTKSNDLTIEELDDLIAYYEQMAQTA